jgi:hypothetical protein
MKHLAHWAWPVVLGTALALSWWSLDALALHFGVPSVLAAMVSATFDGAALVAADLALRRAAVADSAAAVKLLMVVTVGLSAWLNWNHGTLLDYPVAGRVLFAAPSVISGWLFELQLRSLRRARVHELGRAAPLLPSFGAIVWLFHPWAALQHLSRIAESRLLSVPVTVMDWEGAPVSMPGLAGATAEVAERPVLVAASIEADDGCTQEGEARTRQKTGRSPVPDELYLSGLRELVDEAGGVMPSAREVARRLSVGQDRARRLIATLQGEHAKATEYGAAG